MTEQDGGPVMLDWRDARHWSSRPLPCRVCDKATNLRDDDKRPCHKACAEDELMQGMADAQPVAASAAMARARALLAEQNRQAHQ